MNGKPITKKISVAQFSVSRVRGGAEEVVLTLLQRLDRELFDVSLICPPELAALLRNDLPGDVDVLEVYFEHATQLLAASRIASYLRRRHIDILSSHQFCASMLASPLAKIAGVPLTIETPHIRELWRTKWPKSSFAIDRLAGRFVDYYVAVSESNAQFLLEKKQLPKEKIRIIQNGTDLSRFNPAHTAPRELRKSLGLDESDPVIVLIGRLEEQKGHAVLLEALPPVRQKFSNLRVVFVGEGSLRDKLEQQVRTLGLQDCVRFVGMQSNVADWLALANFCVLPSFYEGLPLVAIESLAAGRTMIASAVDGTPEVIVDRKTGLLVPPGVPSALSDAIVQLLSEPALCRELSVAGRAWVMERFDLNRQILETQNLYLEGYEKKNPRSVAAPRSAERIAHVSKDSGERRVAARTE
jgi:glycosyltransferase involved in cell wall biosynthesis